MFGYAGGFRPSLTVISEDLEREQSSYYPERQSESVQLESKTSDDGGIMLPSRPPFQYQMGGMIEESTSLRSDTTGSDRALASAKSATQEPEKRISLARLSSLSKMVLRAALNKGDREEKEEDGEDANPILTEVKRLTKKRSSMMNLFKLQQ
jgi:hypothetical protein